MASTGVPTPTIATIIFVAGAKAAVTVRRNAVNNGNLEKLKNLACQGVREDVGCPSFGKTEMSELPGAILV